MTKRDEVLKISGKLPIDDPRSEVRGRGLHLDDDVPIVTLTVQQTERPADAAEAHMSMGKMELISNAAAKMVNATVTCELTSAEVWTLAKTLIELFGASVSRFANKSTRYGLVSTLIIDLTARRDDGQFWDLGTREDRERLEQCATRTSNRTPGWKRAMHLFPHVTLSLWNEDPN